MGFMENDIREIKAAIKEVITPKPKMYAQAASARG